MASLTRVVEGLITFKTKLAGAITRVLEDKLSESVSVTDFGTRGSDDAQMFQRALSSGAKSIFVPSGTYSVYNLDIPKGVTLWAEPNTVMIELHSAMYWPLTLKDQSSIKGLGLDFSKATLVDKAIHAKDADGATVLNCHIIGPTSGHTIFFDNGDTPATVRYYPSRVEENYIVGGSGAGIYMYGVDEFRVHKNKLHSTNDGIQVNGKKRTRSPSYITENTILESGGQGICTGLMNNAADTQSYEGVIITGNRVDRARANGIICQSDLSVVANNIATDCGTGTDHQGILVNANGCVVTGNVSRSNSGVGIDMGDCRKCSVTSNVVEDNGWLGIEVNSCEQTVVSGNILNRNLRGKTATKGDKQAAILVHSGNGGYPFAGPSSGNVITNNTINSGDGQTYAIFLDDQSKNTIVKGNVCSLVAVVDDIVSMSDEVDISGNITRWSAWTTARASLNGNTVAVASSAEVVYVNGTGELTTISCSEGKIPAGRTLRVVAVGSLAIKSSGGNISLASDITLSANQSILLWWNKGAGAWVRAAT